jgi:hypothetical protein
MQHLHLHGGFLFAIRIQDALLSEFETIFEGSDTDFLYHPPHVAAVSLARVAFRVAGRCEHGPGAFGATIVWSPPAPAPPPSIATPLTEPNSNSSVVCTDVQKAPELSEKEVAARMAAARRAAGGNTFLRCNETMRSAMIVIVPLILSLLVWWLLQTPAPGAARSRYRF